MGTPANAEPTADDSTNVIIAQKRSTSISSPTHDANPVVYKLVRIEGDGRLVPATDDELMEVEGLVQDDKGELPLVEERKYNNGCISNEKFSSKNSELENQEGPFQNEDKGICVKELNGMVKLSRVNVRDNAEAACVDLCLEANEKVAETSVPSAFSSSKPEISTINDMTVRELQEAFRATFGKETSVKDKSWLKRRIAMGLTNSCDVSTATIIMKGKNLAGRREKKVEGNLIIAKRAGGSSLRDESTGAANDGSKDIVASLVDGNEDQLCLSGKRMRSPETVCNMKSKMKSGTGELLCVQEPAVKRVRKPTRRYIEELSGLETRECSGRRAYCKKIAHVHSSEQPLVRPICCVNSTCTAVTRQDSLGGCVVLVPFVCRVRRGRPREDYMALMKYHPIGKAEKLVRGPLSLQVSKRDGERGCIRRASSRKAPQLTVPETEKENQAIETNIAEKVQNREPKKLDSNCGSDGSFATTPTLKGGARRKHHRAWSLCEVIKLVEGVSRYGAGKWSEIKRLSFASYTYRTSVDLKDKWRNLLRASLSQSPSDQRGKSSRKCTSMPVPASILLRVRELAKIHSQGTRVKSSSKLAGRIGRTVNVSRSGYV